MVTSGSDPSPRKVVTFCVQPDVRHIEKLPPEPSRRPRKSLLKMTKKVFEKYDGGQVTDSMLQEASRLFSENYGVWGKEAAKSMGTFAKEGKLRLHIL